MLSMTVLSTWPAAQSSPNVRADQITTAGLMPVFQPPLPFGKVSRFRPIPAIGFSTKVAPSKLIPTDVSTGGRGAVLG